MTFLFSSNLAFSQCSGFVATISGNISGEPIITTIIPEVFNPNCYGIEGVTVTAYGADEYSQSTITDFNGDYQFELCSDNGPFNICVTSTCNSSCGLGTTDLVYYQRYILGQQRSGIWKLIGDVNRSGTITITDLVTIRKIIVGVITAESTGYNFCRFDTPYHLYGIDPSSPPTYDSNCVGVVDIFNPPSLDFKKFALGDLSNSCDDCIFGDGIGQIPVIKAIATTRSSSETGQTIKYSRNKGSLDYSFEKNTKMYLCGFSLEVGNDVDQSDITLNPKLDTADYSINISNNKLSFIYLKDVEKNNSPLEILQNETLFSIQTNQTVSMMKSNNNLLNTPDGIVKLNLAKSSSIGTEPKLRLNSEIIQNHLRIQNLNTQNSYEIMLSDVSGKVLYKSKIKNESTFEKDLSSISQNNIYFLTIFDGQETTTNKLFNK
jgi:hypothetical protein